MIRVSFIQPLDQPVKNRRLLDELKQGLDNGDFNSFLMAVAAATQGTLLRLDSHIKAWKAAGKSIRAVFGVDIGATTVEALKYAMATFDEVYIGRLPGIKFHPKIYIFTGPTKALIFYGSNNFTVPGCELSRNTEQV